MADQSSPARAVGGCMVASQKLEQGNPFRIIIHPGSPRRPAVHPCRNLVQYRSGKRRRVTRSHSQLRSSFSALARPIYSRCTVYQTSIRVQSTLKPITVQKLSNTSCPSLTQHTRLSLQPARS